MKRNININKPEMSSEQIAARRDFGTLQQAYQASGGGASSGLFSKTIYLASGVILVAVGLAIWYFTGKMEGPETIAETSITTTYDSLQLVETLSVVHAPIEGLNVTYTKYMVNSNTGDTLDYSTGSKIMIPPGAFTDSNGVTVTGDVELRYREFHDVAAFFAAGIPMTYDSAAVQYHFESAGMLEITAYQNGERLYTNPTAPIKVEMRSYNASTEFNLYSLEETTGDWMLKGKDKVVVTGEAPAGSQQWDVVAIEELPFNPVQVELTKIKNEIIEFKKSKPVAPVEANPKRNRFDVDVSPNEFPEIAVYKGVFFEVSNKNKDFKEEWYEVIWEDVSLKRMDDSLNYEVTFTKGKQVVSILVYPVLEGKNYEVAKKKFDDKYAVYKTKLQEKLDEEKRLIAEWEAEQKRLKDAAAAQQKKWEQQRLAVNTEQEIKRIFAIDKFGFWNCDYPQNLPKGALVNAEFIDSSGAKLAFPHLYLMEYGRNAAFQYWGKAFNRFQYNPNKKNIVWGMTTNGELAILKPGQLTGKHGAGKTKFVMNVLAEHPVSIEALRALLGMDEAS